jgi:Dual specificity phosphatase, catalytic domain
VFNHEFVMQKFQLSKKAPPLSRTYWVLDELLLAGAYAGQPHPDAHQVRLTGLFNAGMRTIINLMEEHETNAGEPFVRYQEDLQAIASASSEYVDFLRFPIEDRKITTKERMKNILDTIDQSIEKKRPVYVHCFGGIGRTGTVICCWLLRHGHANRDNVFGILRELRKADVERSDRDAPENTLQRQFVLDWQEQQDRQEPRLSSSGVLKDDWFTRLVGFSERTSSEVRKCISVKQNELTSHVNGLAYQCGRLEIVSLSELRKRVAGIDDRSGTLSLSEVVGDAKALHTDPANAGAVFQVASQFNLLEMISPDVTPVNGIGIYENDPTQGPACAIACGAGTIYRNYFVELDGQIGQSETKQVDCLADIGKAIGNTGDRLWKMQNGYALPSALGLAEVGEKLRRMSEPEIDALRGSLQIGIQWDTQVTVQGCNHLVTQAYCSALPIAYSKLPSSQWEPFARLVLDAAYEATLAVGLINSLKTGNRTVYLTLLGGGAFGNDQRWILDAVKRACTFFQKSELDVRIVSYRTSNLSVQQLVKSIHFASKAHRNGT